ncbi:D-ribose pyranase [Frateuria aurantia]|uniref:D-ribose pyranase n=1 Tax=Frateuria aurantia (strain ATCC 33424 / DSM 6220 / KCTC 2777 / LMG 1558 / NBRC 3245 / NCIMB 13370) TaxID=767434 RepID=H8L1D3_FRAAD|nr:D-ribose pyranase [Frateuria aurantia]AFC87542.1 ABC-type ribose transport system, auxiliary component [Frateuria aurantia DSM 6220]
MRPSGLLHAQLSGLIAGLGHTDTLVIADAGLPVAPEVLCIDLALVRGVPDFVTVLDAVLVELVTERLTVARETERLNPAIWAHLLAASGTQITRSLCSHEELKHASRQARAVIRTGECSPYANVILHAGVNF